MKKVIIACFSLAIAGTSFGQLGKDLKEAHQDKKDIKVSDIFGKYTIDRFKNKDQCVILDGVSDYIEIFNEPELNPKNEITISN